MHFSGLLIRANPSSTEDCERELSQCRGLEVYTTDAATGRIVAVLETRTIEEQEAVLRQAQSLPHVVSAELVYRYFRDAQGNASPPPTEDET
jgi:nitrate reductase NapAB chaperone NapD